MPIAFKLLNANETDSCEKIFLQLFNQSLLNEIVLRKGGCFHNSKCYTTSGITCIIHTPFLAERHTR
jgi:hypothetical protein